MTVAAAPKRRGGKGARTAGPESPPLLTKDPLKYTKADLATMSPEQKVQLFLELKRLEGDAKVRNPIGFYEPRPTARKFHESTARIRLLLGGNRSGKTTSGIAEDIFWLSGIHPYREIPKTGNIQGVISGLSFDLVERTAVKIMGELMPKDGFNLEFSRAKGGGMIYGPNGKAYIKSNEQGWESFQGMDLDFGHLDEEHDLEVFKQIRKRLKKGSRLQLWLSMTPEPDRSDHWTYDEIYLKATGIPPDPEVQVFAMSLNENRISRGGYIEDSEIDAVIQDTPVEERPAVIDGVYIRRGGLIYPKWSRDHHLAIERPLSYFQQGVDNGTYTAFCWLDWGIRNPTAIGLLVEDRDGNVQLIDELYRPAKNITDIKEEYNKRFAPFNPLFVIADPSTFHVHDDDDPDLTIAGKLGADDFERHLVGLPMEKGNNDHKNGQEMARELLDYSVSRPPLFTVQPRCSKFIWEIESYVGEEWLLRHKEKNKKELGQKLNNHHMDGFVYFANSHHGHVSRAIPKDDDDRYEVSESGFMRAAVA